MSLKKEVEIKTEISKLLKGIEDLSLRSLLRDILFSGSTEIDWLEAEKFIRSHMPETNLNESGN